MGVENGTGVSCHQPIGADPVLAEEAVGTAPLLAGRERVAGDEKTTPVACGFKPFDERWILSVGVSAGRQRRGRGCGTLYCSTSRASTLADRDDGIGGMRYGGAE